MARMLEIIQALGAIAALIASGLLFTLRAGARGEKVLQAPKDLATRLDAFAARLDNFEKRFDNASEESSDLGTSVQALIGTVAELKRLGGIDHDRLRNLIETVNTQPLSLSTVFVPRREAEVLVQESRTDRERLYREVDSIWRVLRKEKL